MKKVLFLIFMLLSAPAAAKICMIESRNTDLFKLVYPVGSIYMSVNATDPATLFGFGTWEKFAPGRVLVGNGTSDRAFAAGATGGTSTHVLSANEMPSHNHSISTYQSLTGWSRDSPGTFWSVDSNQNGYASSYTPGTNNKGGSAAHNNLQPYIVVNMWVRTE